MPENGALPLPVLVESAPEFDSFYTTANKPDQNRQSNWFELHPKGLAVKVNTVKNLCDMGDGKFKCSTVFNPL